MILETKQKIGRVVRLVHIGTLLPSSTRYSSGIIGIATFAVGNPPRELVGNRDERAPTLDHVVPIFKNGTHDIDNLRCACRRCNLDKGSKNIWESICITIAPFKGHDYVASLLFKILTIDDLCTLWRHYKFKGDEDTDYYNYPPHPLVEQLPWLIEDLEAIRSTRKQIQARIAIRAFAIFEGVVEYYSEYSPYKVEVGEIAPKICESGTWLEFSDFSQTDSTEGNLIVTNILVYVCPKYLNDLEDIVSIGPFEVTVFLDTRGGFKTHKLLCTPDSPRKVRVELKDEVSEDPEHASDISADIPTPIH